MDTSKQVVIHLVASHVTPTNIAKIVESVGFENLNQIYRYTSSDFICMGISQEKSEEIVQSLADQTTVAKELQLIEEYRVFVVTLWCPEYPALLKEIHIPPSALYCQGSLDLFQASNTIACVGARKAHQYVYEVLQHMVTPMIRSGWVVVSGGAAGADTFAHQITLDAGGRTIVVVGSGLCHVYPPQNKTLFARVVSSGGLIVSCFPMSTPPEPHCFPIRNRIIAGLSRGCLVLQAAAKSGALITAQQALDQGREVFAVPGSIFDPLSVGCHKLVQQGAKLVMSVDDILIEFDPLHNVVDQQMTISSAVGTSYKPGSKKQQLVDAVCVPMAADQLIKKLDIDLGSLQAMLFELSMDGVICQDGMGYWKRL